MSDRVEKPAEIQLSDDQFREALVLIGDADSVELKLTVPESDRQSAVTALEMDPLEAQIRQVYFFDTPDLTLNWSGPAVIFLSANRLCLARPRRRNSRVSRERVERAGA